MLFLVNEDQRLYQASGEPYGFAVYSMGVAQWVFINKQSVGATTATLFGAEALYVPLVTEPLGCNRGCYSTHMSVSPGPNKAFV